MSSEVKQTQGLHLVRMGLVRSSFELARPMILEPLQLREIEQRAGRKSMLSVNVAHRHEPGPQDGQVAVYLQTEAVVKLDEEVLAVAQCEYAGFYVRGVDCKVTMQELIDNVGPAHLYAFCREHLADLARRAGGAIFLPPAHFSVVAARTEGQSGGGM